MNVIHVGNIMIESNYEVAYFLMFRGKFDTIKLQSY